MFQLYPMQPDRPSGPTILLHDEIDETYGLGNDPQYALKWLHEQKARQFCLRLADRLRIFHLKHLYGGRHRAQVAELTAHLEQAEPHPRWPTETAWLADLPLCPDCGAPVSEDHS